MPIEFWTLLDTAVKIGLGAAIAAVSAYIVTKLRHRQAVEQAAVRRRLELIEEITAGVSEFGNLITRYCLVSENILNAFYREDSTIGEVPPTCVKERSVIGTQLKSGSALEKPEGLMFLIAKDETLPKALAELRHLADNVMHEAGQDIEDIDPYPLNQKLDKFRFQAGFLMGELGKVYRKPTV